MMKLQLLFYEGEFFCVIPWILDVSTFLLLDSASNSTPLAISTLISLSGMFLGLGGVSAQVKVGKAVRLLLS